MHTFDSLFTLKVSRHEHRACTINTSVLFLAPAGGTKCKYRINLFTGRLERYLAIDCSGNIMPWSKERFQSALKYK